MKHVQNLDQFLKLFNACGGLVPIWFAAIVANVSRPRIYQLLAENRLPWCQFYGRWISLGAVITWRNQIHKSGKPLQLRKYSTVSFPVTIRTEQRGPTTGLPTERKTVKRLFGILTAVFAMLLFGVMPAHAALDSAFTDIVTDLTSYFGSVKTLVISVIVFGLVIAYAKILRKK